MQHIVVSKDSVLVLQLKQCVFVLFQHIDNMQLVLVHSEMFCI